MSFSRLDHIPPPGPDSPTSSSLASLSLDPHKDALHSPAVNTVCNDDEMRARIALEYYNKRNGTNYELACALLSNCFKSDGTWVHCNFVACQPNGDPSRRLFFAEMREDDATTCAWTVTACMVLEGTTTVGCSSCSEVIHPTYGFRQGHHKRKTNLPTSYSPTSYSPTSVLLNPHRHAMSNIAVSNAAPLVIPPAEPFYRELTEIALQYYNKENGANYELVEVLACKCLSSGTWFHCNFMAKKPNGENGDISPKLFFGEVCIPTLIATACIILEESSKTTAGCYWCPDSDVTHPSHGFLKGLDKNDFKPRFIC